MAGALYLRWRIVADSRMDSGDFPPVARIFCLSVAELETIPFSSNCAGPVHFSDTFETLSVPNFEPIPPPNPACPPPSEKPATFSIRAALHRPEIRTTAPKAVKRRTKNGLSGSFPGLGFGNGAVPVKSDRATSLVRQSSAFDDFGAACATLRLSAVIPRVHALARGQPPISSGNKCDVPVDREVSKGKVGITSIPEHDF